MFAAVDATTKRFDALPSMDTKEYPPGSIFTGALNVTPAFEELINQVLLLVPFLYTR